MLLFVLLVKQNRDCFLQSVDHGLGRPSFLVLSSGQEVDRLVLLRQCCVVSNYGIDDLVVLPHEINEGTELLNQLILRGLGLWQPLTLFYLTCLQCCLLRVPSVTVFELPFEDCLCCIEVFKKLLHILVGNGELVTLLLLLDLALNLVPLLALAEAEASLLLFVIFHLFQFVIVERIAVSVLFIPNHPTLGRACLVHLNEALEGDVNEPIDDQEAEDDEPPVWFDLLVVGLDTDLCQRLLRWHRCSNAVDGIGATLRLCDDSNDSDCAAGCILEDVDSSVFEDV